MYIYTMPSTIVLTQNDIQNSDNNVLEYSLPTGAQFDNHEVCVESVALNYSWPNINGTTLNNDVFQYQWTVGSTTTTHTVTLPEGSSSSGRTKLSLHVRHLR